MDQKNCLKIAGVTAIVTFLCILIVWVVWDPMSVEGRGLIPRSSQNNNNPQKEDTAIHTAFVQNLGKPLASTSLWFRFFIRENPHFYGTGSVLPDSILFPDSTSAALTSLEAVETSAERNATEVLKRSKRFFPFFPTLPLIRLSQLGLQITASTPSKPEKAEGGLKKAPALFR